MRCSSSFSAPSQSASPGASPPTCLSAYPPPCRFEREVLGGRLWHAACQAAAGDIGEQIPLKYTSGAHTAAAAAGSPAAEPFACQPRRLTSLAGRSVLVCLAAAVDEYIRCFEPLVLEEAREGVRSDWAEGCASPWAVEVASVEQEAEGWCQLKLRALEGAHTAMRRACTPGAGLFNCTALDRSQCSGAWSSGTLYACLWQCSQQQQL